MNLREIPSGLVVASQRVWQAAAGLITAVLVVHILTPQQQGWYYGLTSAVALFTLFDSGLSLILVQRSAALHTGMKLSARGEPQGDLAEKFVWLVAFARRWYFFASLLFIAILLPGGLWFFSSAPSASAPSSWHLLWLLLLLVTAANLWLLPFMSLVEGGGEVAVVYGLRLVQGVAGAICCWLLLLVGGQVWASLAVPAAAATVGLIWLYWRKPALAVLGRGQDYSYWCSEVRPQQWRLGLSWASGFLLTQIYTPLLLNVEGPVVAGQMGLTLTIANMLSLVSQSWLTQAYPGMSAHAARREWSALDRLFARATGLSTVCYVAGALVLATLLMLPVASAYLARLLPVPTLLMLFAATFVNQLCAALAVHLRATGQEPFAWVSATGAAITFVGAFVVLGSHGVNGLVAVMLGVQLLFALPLCLCLWRLRRRILVPA